MGVLTSSKRIGQTLHENGSRVQMKQNYHGHIYYDVEDQRKDTVDSAVTVADFTDQDRLDFLRGQYYVRFTSEYSTEESKSNFPSLKTT